MNETMKASWQRQAVDGARWMGLGTMVGRLLVFLTGIVLARLLLPLDFGRNAMALVVSNLLITIGTLGTGTALIQRQDRTEDYANSAFWLGLGLGGMLTLIQSLAAPFVGRMYSEPVVTAILLLTAPMHLLVALGNTPLALLSKHLSFKESAVCNMSGAMAGSMASIGLAVLGFGVWSLAWTPTISLGISGLLALGFCGWRPRWGVERETVMNLLHYTGRLLPGEICVFLNYNLDNLIVGARLGAKALGYYSFAYTLGMFLAIVIGSIMLSVIFPIFSRLQGQRDQLRLCYQHVLSATGVIGGPITIWLIMESPFLVPWVFGEKWIPAILPLQIVSLLGLVRTVAMQPASALAKAIGRPDLGSKNAIVLTPLAVAGFLFGSQFGIVGVSLAALGVLGAGALVFMTLVIRAAGWTLSGILNSFAWPITLGAATWLLLALRRIAWTTDSGIKQVAVDLALLVLVYGFVVILLYRRLLPVIRRTPFLS